MSREIPTGASPESSWREARCAPEETPSTRSEGGRFAGPRLVCRSGLIRYRGEGNDVREGHRGAVLAGQDRAGDRVVQELGLARGQGRRRVQGVVSLSTARP